LLDYRDIEGAKKAVIDKEAASIMRSDIEEVADSIRKKWSIVISESRRWKEFKERFYRRHMIIHNNGEADNNYRLKTGNANAKGLLEVTQDYLTESIDIFSEISRLIADKFHEKLDSS
jgi:hypothetical protein